MLSTGVLSLRSLFGDDAAILLGRNFQLLLLANVMAPLGTALLSPMLDSLVDPLGTSPANIGLMISFFTAPPILMTPIMGVLADRYGRKPILVFSLFLFGSAGSAIALTTTFHVALVLRFVQGIAFAGLTPIIITSIGDIYTGTKETTGQGLRFSVSGLSAAIFPLIAGALVTIAWQYPFFMYAASIPVALLVWIGFGEPSTSKEPTTERSDGTYQRSLLKLVGRRRVLAMVIARGLPGLVWIGFLTYNSIIVVRLLDGTPAQAGLLTAIASFVFASVASQAGRITNLFSSRFLPLAIGNVSLGVGFSLMVFAPSIIVAGMGVGLIGVGIGSTLSLYRSIITGMASAHLRGKLVSISEASGRIIQTITPIAMGFLIAVTEPSIGFTSAIRVAGLVTAVVGGGGGLLCIAIARVSPLAPAELTSE